MFFYIDSLYCMLFKYALFSVDLLSALSYFVLCTYLFEAWVTCARRTKNLSSPLSKISNYVQAGYQNISHS